MNESYKSYENKKHDMSLEFKGLTNLIQNERVLLKNFIIVYSQAKLCK